MNNRCTYMIPEEVEELLTELYIKRLKSANKMTRSAIVAEAIRLLWEREKKKWSVPKWNKTVADNGYLEVVCELLAKKPDE